ncbi:S8 family serine peptidase [Streptomyces sp. NPDC097610]|uniref:S8 family serine peptidase n=1 Tax=Streptomyces sp. NPDC097610 TaxID=3157227 RepID=UPI0033224471
MNTTVVGTSQAAAHVAGLAAYLLSTAKDLTPATVGKATTTLVVPDRLLDLSVGSRTCWRSTTRRPADHLPTEGRAVRRRPNRYPGAAAKQAPDDPPDTLPSHCLAPP